MHSGKNIMKMSSGRTITLIMGAWLLLFCTSGCQKIKSIFIKPPLEELVQESYPIKVYAYESSVVVKASPQELVRYFLKDISWIEKFSGALQIEFRDLSPGIDITSVGQSIGFDIKILGIKFPCRIITFKYKPEKDLWLMVLTDGNWVLGRFEFEPVPEGSMVKVNGIACPSKTLAAILDTFQLAEAIAARADLLMAFVQSEFDPELDVKELTEKGLRGELYEAFIQADEASVWVDASPNEVVQWMANNFESYLPEMKTKEGCIPFTEFVKMPEGQVMRCPAEFEFLNLKFDIDTFFTWREKSEESICRIYAQGLGLMGLMQLGITPEAGGTRLECIIGIEIPGSASHRIMDIIMALTAIPKREREFLLDIKRGVEGVG
jgi:hypothetical protein